jgi:deazaflavin-dependent oxidoreductase (nitroreductase family)
VEGSHSNSRFLYLTTKGWKTGQEHKIEIWFVEHDKKYYIMSETMEKAHWVQNIMHNSHVKIILNNNAIEATARIIDKVSDPQLESEISKLMSSKPVAGLIVELKPE